DAVVLRSLVPLRPEVRVALDDQQPAAAIEGDADGVDDVRGGGEKSHLQPRILGVRHLYRRRLRGRGRRQAPPEGKDQEQCGQAACAWLRRLHVPEKLQKFGGHSGGATSQRL